MRPYGTEANCVISNLVFLFFSGGNERDRCGGVCGCSDPEMVARANLPLSAGAFRDDATTRRVMRPQKKGPGDFLGYIVHPEFHYSSGGGKDRPRPFTPNF